MDKLTEVVDKYGNMVYRLAISYLKNTHDAQDVVQEVFIKYYNNEGKIQSEEHLKSWLLRVTINLCKNKLMLFWHKNVCSIDEIKEQAYSDNYEDNTVLEAVLALPVKYRVPICIITKIIKLQKLLKYWEKGKVQFVPSYLVGEKN